MKSDQNTSLTCEHIHSQKHFWLWQSWVWATTVSQHACFDGFHPYFWVSLLVFTTSLSYAVVIPMKPDIVTVRSGMFFTRWAAGCVHISLLVPQKPPLRLHCLLTLSLWMNEKLHTSHVMQEWTHNISKKSVEGLFSAPQCSGYCCTICAELSIML